MATKDRAPSFQFYPRDFVSSSAVIRMTPEERGGYIMLLCHAWDCDEPGVLPDDDAALASLSGLGKRWTRCRPAIARAFVVEDGRWRQERMIAERDAQADRFRRASEAGRKANATRWGERSESDANRMRDG